MVFRWGKSYCFTSVVVDVKRVGRGYRGAPAAASPASSLSAQQSAAVASDRHTCNRSCASPAIPFDVSFVVCNGGPQPSAAASASASASAAAERSG